MSLKNPKPGISAPEFMVSVIPWVTQSVCTGIKREIFGGYLTKFIVIENRSAPDLTVGFTLNGIQSTNNLLTLSQNESISADVRVSEIYLSGSGNTYQIIAGITGIPSGTQHILTGSAGYPGIG